MPKRHTPLLPATTAAVIGSLFSTIILVIILIVQVAALIGPAFAARSFLSRSGCGVECVFFGTIATQIAASLLICWSFLKPLRAASRPGSGYARRNSFVLFLRLQQVILSLLISGPVRIVFLGKDPKGLVTALRWKIRDIDARILRVRPPLYRVDDTDITIPLRDGIMTAATLYSPLKEDGTPDHETPRPVVLVRTPYNRESLGLGWGVRFAERGYHFVAQDTRGRFGSTGEFFPMLNEATDGAATVEWLAKQPWCDGHVGMTGVSYLGLCAWAAMREEVPALKAVAPVLAATDLYNVMFGRGGSGAAHVELLFRWSHLVMHLMNKPYGMIEAIPNFFMGTGEKLRSAYKHAPLREADTKFLCPDREPLEWFQDGFAHPLGTEPFWEDKRKFVDFAKMSKVPPVLLFCGWYDFFCTEQLHDFQTVSALSDTCRLVVGPYTHWHVLAMQPKLFRTLLDFFDKYLLKDPGAKDLPPVEVFSMGHDMGWKQLPSWPPPNLEEKKMLLVQEADGSNAIVEDDGKREVEEREASYTYDPAHPTPQIGGSTFNPSNCGRVAQNTIEDRSDVLVFTSKPLAEAMTVAGEIKVRLQVVSNVEGTDYVARACHVTPDGTSFNLADGIVRRFDLRPGRRFRIEITLSPVMNRLAKGDRFRLQLCSSAYPKYGRHLNTRESFHLEVEENALLSKQMFTLGGENGCNMLVPILP